MDATVNLPAEFVKDPLGYIEKSPEEMKKFPLKVAKEIEKSYLVIQETTKALFPNGLNPDQQNEMAQALASRDPERVKELTEKFNNRGLTAKELAAIEQYFGGTLSGKDLKLALSPEAQDKVFLPVGLFFDGTGMNANAGDKTSVSILESTDPDGHYIRGIGTDGIMDYYVCGSVGCGEKERINEGLERTKQYMTIMVRKKLCFIQFPALAVVLQPE